MRIVCLSLEAQSESQCGLPIVANHALICEISLNTPDTPAPARNPNVREIDLSGSVPFS
jgi:hypothetical protein